MNHPLSKYGLALVLRKNSLEDSEINQISHEMLIEELHEGLRKFRFHTDSDPELNESLVYKYYGIEDFDNNPSLIQSAGLAGKGMFLCQNILTEEKSAKKVFGAVKKIINLLESKADLSKPETITMSISPVSGKINQGKLSQSNPSSTLIEVCCYAIGNIHPLKPSFSANNLNYGLIPDLQLNELIIFLDFLDHMFSDCHPKLLNVKSKDGKYRRPHIIRGNYPDAPYHPIFGPVGLIASIGKWSKEADIPEGMKVLNLLKDVPI